MQEPLQKSLHLKGDMQRVPSTLMPRYKFDVRRFVHHHTNQINQPTRCISFTSLLLDVYVWLNMFRASPRPSSGAYNCNRNLWFYRWSVVDGAWWLEHGSWSVVGRGLADHLSAHRQERTSALGASGFTVGAWWMERGGWSVVGRGLADHD